MSSHTGGGKSHVQLKIQKVSEGSQSSKLYKYRKLILGQT